MKITGKNNDPSQSCSCTSCVLHSGSDNVSLHKLLLKGSRIDKLYYGKYIPLRERKLLDKLVRTRAVYDDIRAQLVSESTSSLHKNANFKRKSSASEVDDTEKSSAILELVNLVDKGAALKSSKLSECCSCCSCSSQLHTGEHMHKAHRHRHAHGSRYAAEQRRHEFKKKKGVRFKAKHIKSDPCTCTFQFSGLDQKKLEANDQGKLKEKLKESTTNLKNKLAVGMQKVHDSKTKLQEAIAVHTQDSIEKLKRMKEQIKSVKQSPEIADYENVMWIAEERTKTQRIKDLATESLEKIKTSQTKLKKKLQEGGEKIELKVKKSLEKIKKSKHQIKKIICKCPESVEYGTPGEKVLALKIRKDSIRKFKENLSRKHNLKDWTCENDCVEGTCMPEKCYEMLKLRKAKKQKLIDKRDMGSGTTVSPKKSNTGMQAYQTNLEIVTKSKKQRKVKRERDKITKEEVIRKKKIRPTSSSFDSDAEMQDYELINLQKRTKIQDKMKTKRPVEIKKNTRAEGREVKQTLSSEQDTDDMLEDQTKVKPEKDLKLRKEIKAKKTKATKKLKERPASPSLSSGHSNTRQAVRVGSSFSFNIEFYKDKANTQAQQNYPKKKSEFEQSSVLKISRPRKDDNRRKKQFEKQRKKSQVEFKKSKKDLKRKGYALKRCFCTLKLKTKKRKSHSQKSIGTMSSFRSSVVQMGRKEQIEELLPYECEPGICVPYKCNPNICLQLINKRLAAQKRIQTKQSYTSSRKTRSTSSVTPLQKPSKAKQVQSAIIPRRMQAYKKEKLKTYRVQRPLVARPNRNVVRIGSSFSFNIDFFKDTGQQLQPFKQTQPKVHSLAMQPKVKEQQGKPTKMVYEKQAKPTKNVQEKLAKPTKVKEPKKQKIKHVCACTSTETEKSIKKTRNQATKTEKNVPYFLQLEPYECEPYACIPGECDPYICFQKIKKRNKNTHEISLGTYPESRSTSSYTHSQKSKHVFAQYKPHTKGRKILAKEKVTRLTKTKEYQHMEPPPRANKLKNAVSVGSTFSFNIEFSKNYSRSDSSEDTSPPPMQINLKTKQKVRHKGIKINKMNIDNASTQIAVKKAEKSSIVGPILKRCFCTLNLYKKQKRDKKAVYAVNTAFIESTLPRNLLLDCSKRKKLNIQRIDNGTDSDSQLSFFSNISDKGHYKGIAYRRSAIHINPVYACVKTKQSLEINSDLSINVELVKKSSNSEVYLNKTQLLEQILKKNYKRYLKLKDNYNINARHIEKNITGFSNYLNNYFYAMNMQIENNPKRKLKPYECEPGVCIPGQCNPYECQKLILKRLQKGFSKSSATDTKSQSITSSQTEKSLTQSNVTNTTIMSEHKEKPMGNVQRHGGDQKKMVRVGSSFSFDVEFFKNRSYSTDTSKQYEVEPKRKSTVSKRTKIKRPSSKKKERQIVTKQETHDRESQSEQQNLKDKTSHTIQKMQRCFCTLKLQKKGRITPKVKSTAKSNKMLTDTSQEETISVKTVNRGQNTKQKKSSKVTRELLPYECEPGICIPGECDPYECLALINNRKLKERGTDTPVSKKITASNTTDLKKKKKSRAVFVQPKPQPVIHPEKPKEYIVESPKESMRQAVKIGSSFSFNIDFYKTNLPSNKMDTMIKTKKSKISQKIKKESTRVEVTKPKKSIKIVTPSVHSKVSQTVKELLVSKSTAVEPFLKRCFCTLQLKNKEKKVSKEKTREDAKKPEYKSVMTMTKSKKRSIEKRRTKPKVETHELLPYECEPTFCTPGECDPLVCLERIKKRNVKSLGTEVVSKKRKDVGSIATLKTNKDKKIQLEQIDIEPKPKVEYKRTSPKIDNRLGQKQMVRIGSNFSFNVEFFKDSGDHHHKIVYDNYEKPTKPSKKITEKIISKKSTNQTVSKMPKTEKTIYKKNSMLSRHSQTQNKSKSTKSGGLIYLKRCFCTLALKNNSKVTTKKLSKDVLLKTPTEGKESKSKKQVDETKNEEQVYDKTQNNIQPKDEKSKSKKQKASEKTVKLQEKSNNKTEKSKTKTEKSKPKTEQSKPKTEQSKPKTEQSKPKTEQSKPKTEQSKNKTEKSKNKIEKKSKGSVHKVAQRTKSTVSVVSTFIKKYISVLTLSTNKKSEIKPIVNVQIKPQKLRSTKLEPYECEPGVCIPDECDPYECEKLIKKRLLRENATETKTIKSNTKSIVTPAPKSHKSQNNKSQHIKSKHIKSKHVEPPPIKEIPTKILKPSPTISSDYDTTNRQSVRIGSSFSFDIEFFKHGSSKQAKPSDERVAKIKDIETKSVSTKKPKKEIKLKSTKQSWQNVGKYDASQSTNVKTQPSSTITDPLLKRCFCTLQLHKSAARIKSSHKSKRKPLQTPVQNKRTSTKKTTTVSYMTSPHEYPFMCKPNKCNPKECNPRECHEKMKYKAGDQTSKISKRDTTISHKSVTTKSLSTKSKKIQTQVLECVPFKADDEQTGIVEVPRFINKENTQAVRYGSNFSFNIEFYREVLPPLSLPTSHDKKKNLKSQEECVPLNCLSNKSRRSSLKPKSICNTQSQVDRIKTQSKRSMTNKLKQCFCTLKLQKSKSECKTLFPQKIEVRRVEIQRNNKKSSKKTNTETKSVSTKIDNKLIQPKSNQISTPQKNNDKMTTILAYRPTKFNKNVSKTSLIEEKQNDKKERIKMASFNVTNYGKRLTRKKSLNEIYCTKQFRGEKSINPTLKQYLCRCPDNFSCKSKNKEPSHSGRDMGSKSKNKKPSLSGGDMGSKSKNKKPSLAGRDMGSKSKNKKPSLSRKDMGSVTKLGIKLKLLPKENIPNKLTNNRGGPMTHDFKTRSSDQQPTRDHESKNKTSKSVSGSKNNKNNENCLCKKRKKLSFKDLIMGKNECKCKESLRLSKIEKDCLCPRKSGAGDYKLLSDALTMIKSRLNSLSIEDENPFVCPKCLEMHKPREEKNKVVDFKDLSTKLPQNSPKHSIEESRTTSKTQKKSKTKKQSKSVCESCARPIPEKCQYCEVCARSQSISGTMKRKFGKLIKFFQKKEVGKKEVETNMSKPLFDVLLESDSHCIINREEVSQKVTELHMKNIADIKKKGKKKKAEKHDEFCQCCICLGQRSGPKKKKKKGPKEKVTFGKCTCGSGVCAHKLREMKADLKAAERNKHYKPCVCGSTVCYKESTLMRQISKSPKSVSCTCKEIMDKRRKREKAKADKEYKKRRKTLDMEEEMEDITRRKYRAKENKRLNKSLKKNATDATLIADSVVDVGRFGIRGLADLIRTIFRWGRDPKNAANKLRRMRDNPSLVGKSLLDAVSETGLTSTARRIGKRVESMESVKAATRYLEQYAVPNYIMHINDPKKRINPRVLPKRKERIEFHCNLFMGSLRRRPYLWIYDRWPWFYPHCLTFLNIWRQFADLLLFLLAVVVWSPCIFAMEMCRAIMCCTFCTG